MLRNALLGLTALVLATHPIEAQRRATQRTIITAPASRTGTYTAGALAGKRVSDLYSHYTGVQGSVPANVTVDFCKQLQTMWNIKANRRDASPVSIQTGQQIVNEYCRKRNARTLQHKTIDEYIARADSVVQSIQRSFDWEGYAQAKRLTPQQLAATRTRASRLDGRDIVAYALTEMMPSPAGIFNVQVLDFLLRNAGVEYVESIPAMFDGKTSFGPFQFTEYALYENGRDRRGASVPNRFVRDARVRVPGSVAQLRGRDHIAAAYLFSLDNIANLAKRASPRELSVFARLGENKESDLIEYLGSAHHGPNAAIRFGRLWLANNVRSDYRVSTSGRFEQYARKTESNHAALTSRRTFGRILYNE